MRDAYLSIAEHVDEPRLLQVRSRIEGDIERVFPEAEVVEMPEEDYRYQTSVSRERAAQVIALRLGHINYTTLSGSLEDPERYATYVQVLATMQEDQQLRLDRHLELDREVPRHDLDRGRRTN